MKYTEIALSKDLVYEAKNEAKTLTQKLEELDPTTQYVGTPEANLDAFERQLLRAKIIPCSNATLGTRASLVDAFFQAPDSSIKSLFPEFIERVIREEQMLRSILPYLIAIDTPITGNTYRAAYIDDQVLSQKKRPIPVGSPLPKVTFTLREKAVNIEKYGIEFEAAYETTRWMTLDYFALFVRRVALQNALDESETAISTLLTGDGNPNTAATSYPIQTVNADATKGTLDYKSWLLFAAKFRPYMLNVAVGGELAIIDFLTMQFPEVDPLKVVALLKSGQPQTMTVRLGVNLYGDITLWISDHASLAGEKKLLAVDSAYALQRLSEVGSAIRENGRWIERQTEILTISENSGFASLFAKAAKVLDYSA